MAYKTFGALSSQVSKELDIEDEEFIQSTELVGYFDSGVRVVEAELIKLGLREKYLQDEAFISTVAGQADYSLPPNIIDTKIRKLVYRNGPTIYTMNPMKNEDMYQAEDILNLYESSEWYMWELYKLTEEYTLRIVPKASLSVANAIRVIFYKDLNRFVADSTNCDMPEICYEFLLSYVRYRVYKKENNALLSDEKEYLASTLTNMRETLSGQIADPTIDLIDQDLSIYTEMS